MSVYLGLSPACEIFIKWANSAKVVTRKILSSLLERSTDCDTNEGEWMCKQISNENLCLSIKKENNVCSSADCVEDVDI